MKQLLLIVSLAFTTQNSIAQREAWNWYFGDHAGVNFSTGSPVPLTNNAFFTGEGVATISDTSGNLLFYTDGSNIYDATHDTMPNGFGLLGHPSSTQSAIIVKLPGSNNLYYVFTVDYNYNNASIIGTGLRYSIVDMTLNGGLGDVVPSEKNILVRQRAYEKLTAVRHANTTDFWILINDWVDDDIYSYHLSSSGLDTIPVISNVGPFHGHTLNTLGYLKASRQNNRLALGTWNYNLFAVLDFDNDTGIASNRINIAGSTSTMRYTYGVEFSPDGTKLYGTTMASPFKVIQFDLSSNNGNTIFANRTILATHSASLCNNYYYGALQIAPDGNIYGTTECDSFLNVINFPDSLGTLCNYVGSAISLSGRQCKLGLPNFVSDYAFPNSITELENNFNLKIYPNPTSENLTISIEKNTFKKLTCNISDFLGKNIFKTDIKNNSILKLDVSYLSQGIYFLQLNIDGILTNRKFVVYK